jgi:hypothetical protein
MKKALKILLCLATVLILFNGCGDKVKEVESSYTIKVTGSENLKVSVHYSFVGLEDFPKPVKVETVIPVEYNGKGVAAVCFFRKTMAEGTLKVEILKDEKVAAMSETTQPFGVVSLGKIPETNSIINKILGLIMG